MNGMKTKFFLILFFVFFVNAFSQSDTIIRNDTVIVIVRNTEPPKVVEFYLSGNFDAAKTAFENDNDYFKRAKYKGFYLQSIIESSDTARVLEFTNKNFGIYPYLWMIKDEDIKNIVGIEYMNDYAKRTKEKFIKEYPNINFDYFVALTHAGHRTSFFRNIYPDYFNNEAKGNDIFKRQHILDSLNVLSIDTLIKKYGVPSKENVLEFGISSFLLCVQHFDKDNLCRYKKYIKQIYKNNDMRPVDYALYMDRYLIYKGKKQLYATQLTRNENGKLEFYPIKNKTKVDKRRKEMGFDESANDYLRNFSH